MRFIDDFQNFAVVPSYETLITTSWTNSDHLLEKEQLKWEYQAKVMLDPQFRLKLHRLRLIEKMQNLFGKQLAIDWYLHTADQVIF